MEAICRPSRVAVTCFRGNFFSKASFLRQNKRMNEWMNESRFLWNQVIIQTFKVKLKNCQKTASNKLWHVWLKDVLFQRQNDIVGTEISISRKAKTKVLVCRDTREIQLGKSSRGGQQVHFLVGACQPVLEVYFHWCPRRSVEPGSCGVDVDLAVLLRLIVVDDF